MSDIRDEFEDFNLGKDGIPLAKRQDNAAKGLRIGQDRARATRAWQAQYDRQQRPEPSLPKFKCLED